MKIGHPLARCCAHAWAWQCGLLHLMHCVRQLIARPTLNLHGALPRCRLSYGCLPLCRPTDLIKFNQLHRRGLHFYHTPGGCTCWASSGRARLLPMVWSPGTCPGRSIDPQLWLGRPSKADMCWTPISPWWKWPPADTECKWCSATTILYRL